ATLTAATHFYTLSLHDALPILSLLLLPNALADHSGMSIFTVFYGLDWIATVPPTVKLVTDAFGPRDAGIVYGWVVASHQVGAGMAALGAGIIRTAFGEYRMAFMTSGILCLVAAGCALAIGRGRRVIPAAEPTLASAQEARAR